MSVAFSIVVPTFNRAQLMIPTLQSVWAQTYQNFELIVVDNCSTDETDSVLGSLQDQGKLVYLRNDCNRERAFSRNRGIRAATGRYITFLDSDDILYPTCLEKSDEFVHGFPKVDFFHCRADWINRDYEYSHSKRYPPIGDIYRALTEGNYISNIGGFFRRELLERVQFDLDPDLTGVEDYDFILRVVACCEQPGFLDEALCAIQIHEGRSVLNESYERVKVRMEKFIQRHRDSPAFVTGRYAAYRVQFVSHQRLFTSGAAAVRRLPWAAIEQWLRAVSALPRILLTVKAWHHLGTIVKHAARSRAC